MKTRLVLIALAGATVVVAHLLLTGHSAPASEAHQPPEVSVAPAMQRMLGERDDFTGRLQPVEYVQVRARVDGYVQARYFAEGALLHKGQLLFQIDPRPYQAEVDRLRGELAQVQAELTLAQANAARARDLDAKRDISREEADRQITDEESARARLTSASGALETAKLHLSFAQIRSPIDGRVSNAFVTAGNFVTSADVLTTVVSMNPIYAYFDVDEHTYLRMIRQREAASANNAAGARIAMALADEDDFPHEGRIDFVDNQLRAGAGTIRLRAVFDNADGKYTPGQYVRVRLESGDARKRILVDDRAIGTELGNQFVYVLGKDHKITYRQVEVGPTFNGLRVIDSGLEVGDLIVVNGIQRVRPGIEVKPVPVDMTAWLDEAERKALAATAASSGPSTLASVDPARPR